MHYCVPGSPPSVTVGRHLEARGMPAPLPAHLCEQLQKYGIQRLVLGHTPHGNAPTIIQCGEESSPFLIVMADTSYSDVTCSDMRGAAVCELVLAPDATMRVRGSLPDGQAYDFTLGRGVGERGGARG